MSVDVHQTEPEANPKCDSLQSASASEINKVKPIIICFICGTYFKLKDDFESHTKELHPNSDKPRKCSKCYKTFPNLKTLTRHKCVEKIASFVCENCGRSFASQCNLMQHMKTHQEKPEFSCSKCDYKCNAKYRILAHMKRHGDMPVTCRDCGSQCIDKDDLAKHVCDRPDLKQFCCEVCGKTFYHKSRLFHHRTIHLEESNFECNLCDKKFKSASRLAIHKRRLHLKKKRFICNHCSKGFLTSYHLKRHQRLHTGETPYKCTICGKAYPWRTSLKQHMKHHEMI